MKESTAIYLIIRNDENGSELVSTEKVHIQALDAAREDLYNQVKHKDNEDVDLTFVSECDSRWRYTYRISTKKRIDYVLIKFFPCLVGVNNWVLQRPCNLHRVVNTNIFTDVKEE